MKRILGTRRMKMKLIMQMMKMKILLMDILLIAKMKSIQVIALDRLGGKSNTGEEGKNPDRYLNQDPNFSSDWSEFSLL